MLRNCRLAHVHAQKLPFVLQHVHSTIPVADVQRSIGRHVDIAGLGGEPDVWSRINELLWDWRHPGRDFPGRKGILDIEDAYAGIVVGCEDDLFAAERAGPILVDVVRAEHTIRAEVPVSWRR